MMQIHRMLLVICTHKGMVSKKIINKHWNGIEKQQNKETHMDKAI